MVFLSLLDVDNDTDIAMSVSWHYGFFERGTDFQAPLARCEKWQKITARWCKMQQKNAQSGTEGYGGAHRGLRRAKGEGDGRGDGV